MLWNPRSWCCVRLEAHFMISNQVTALAFGYSGCGWIIRHKQYLRGLVPVSQSKRKWMYLSCLGEWLGSWFSVTRSYWFLSRSLSHTFLFSPVPGECRHVVQTETVLTQPPPFSQLLWTTNCFDYIPQDGLFWALLFQSDQIMFLISLRELRSVTH